MMLNPIPDLIIVDALLENEYRNSSLRRRLEATFNLPIVIIGETPTQRHESSDSIRLTLPPQQHLWADLYQAAMMTRKLHKIISMMRQTVERPSEFSLADLFHDKLDQSLFDDQFRSAQRRFQLMAATVQQTREGILLLKSDYSIDYMNNAAEKILQSSRLETIGKLIGQIKLAKLGKKIEEIIKLPTEKEKNCKAISPLMKTFSK